MDTHSEAVSIGSLLEKYQHDIDRWIGHRTRGMPNREHFAEEVLQETRIRIWKRSPDKASNQGPLPERAWVYCQTREAFIDVWRRERRTKRGQVAAGHFDSWIAGIAESKIMDSITGLLSQLARKEAVMRAIMLVEQLKQGDRESVTMRDIDGLSFREIGAALQMPEDRARQTHFRAIARLRDKWNKEFPDSTSGHR